MTQEPPRDVSVVIVSWNAREELLACLRALSAGARRVLETFVVDNASTDGSPAAVRQAFPSVKLIENGTNEGFGRANNRALRAAHGRYALILNSDAELREGALDTLARHLDDHPRVAVVGPRTWSGDGTPQLSFGQHLTPLREWRQGRLVRALKRREAWALAEALRLSGSACEPDWVSASCLMARTDALAAVGFFDEGFFLYEEDADLCLRLRRVGWQVAFTPEAEVSHRLGASMSKAPALARVEYQRSHLRYYRKHNGTLRTTLLRALLVARATLGLLRSPGTAGRDERRVQRAILRLALTRIIHEAAETSE